MRAGLFFAPDKYAMPRYFRKPPAPRSYEDDDEDYDWPSDPLITNLEVIESEAVFTGLLDSDGEPIWRAPNPIGFGRDDEWFE